MLKWYITDNSPDCMLKIKRETYVDNDLSLNSKIEDRFECTLSDFRLRSCNIL